MVNTSNQPIDATVTFGTKLKCDGGGPGQSAAFRAAVSDDHMTLALSVAGAFLPRRPRIRE